MIDRLATLWSTISAVTLEVMGPAHLPIPSPPPLLTLYVCRVSAMMTDPGAVPRNAEPLPEEAEHWGNAEEGKNAHDGRRQVRKYCKR